MNEKGDWPFPVPEKVKSFSGSFGVDANTLLKTILLAEQEAWRESIEPRIKNIRLGNVDTNSVKSGLDFFTEADTESEKTIRERITSSFGEDTFRIWGEEANEYLGNLDASLTIRIDPIDSTENFKFGKPQWSIMVGVYTGRDESERQVLSAIYYPEYFNEVLYRIDGLGVFITNCTTGATEEILTIDEQNDLSEIYTMVSRDENPQREKLDTILLTLERKGARVKSTSTIEAKEALQTRGRRAVITNSRYGQQDYIAYSMLAAFGYRIFDSQGRERSMDDPALTGVLTLIVPPGKAGESIVAEFVAAGF